MQFAKSLPLGKKRRHRLIILIAKIDYFWYCQRTFLFARNSKSISPWFKTRQYFSLKHNSICWKPFNLKSTYRWFWFNLTRKKGIISNKRYNDDLKLCLSRIFVAVHYRKFERGQRLKCLEIQRFAINLVWHVVPRINHLSYYLLYFPIRISEKNRIILGI